MEYAAFPLRIKSVEDAGRFTGLASTYGEPADLQGDVIAPGAFTRAINGQGPGLPLLLGHRQDAVLGLAKLEDNQAGLLVHGELDMSDPAAISAFNKIKMKALRGLSIGFLPVPGRVDLTDAGGRLLREVKLFEVSLTPVPANERAQVFEVRSLADARAMLHQLQERHLEPAALLELKSIDAELRKLLRATDPAADAKEALARDLAAFAAECKTFNQAFQVSA